MSAYQIRALLGAAALGALATACADDSPPTAPNAPSQPAFAVGDVYTVTNTNDAGVGSLRWALGWTTGGETIRFDPGLAGQTITLDSALVVSRSVTIEGPAAKGVTISGGGKGRVFYLPNTTTDTLRNLSITNGYIAGHSGGAIYGYGNLVLEHSTVYGNKADGVGAIWENGTLTLINSTVSGNASLVAWPEAVAYGTNKLVMINSTVAYNTGGGVSGNQVALRNSIIANNASGRNCQAYPSAFTYEGVNLSNDDTCGGPSDMLIADPRLAPLADNGGPGMTHALLAGSQAINAGTSCTVGVDQRYVARDAQCDLGAFEFIEFTSVTLTIDPGAAVSQSGGWAVVTGTVTCSRDETFNLAVELTQVQRVGRETTDVHSARTVPVTCTTGARPWSASMYLTSGAFKTGTAQATAMTIDTPGWVAPASAAADVKLYWGRR